MHDESRTAILDLMEAYEAMALGTVRPDGFPQVTVVNFVHDELSVYFWCDSKTQKARNLALNPKVSAVLGDMGGDWSALKGLSLGGVAHRIADRDELDLAMTLSLAKYPQMTRLVPRNFEHPLLFRIDPIVFSILDYTQGFGEAKLVACDAPDRRTVARASARLSGAPHRLGRLS